MARFPDAGRRSAPVNGSVESERISEWERIPKSTYRWTLGEESGGPEWNVFLYGVRVASAARHRFANAPPLQARHSFALPRDVPKRRGGQSPSHRSPKCQASIRTQTEMRPSRARPRRVSMDPRSGIRFPRARSSGPQGPGSNPIANGTDQHRSAEVDQNSILGHLGDGQVATGEHDGVGWRAGREHETEGGG